MARSTPPDRFDALIRAATAVFLRQGYRRTQMADVAEELGVAKGTLYLYVESKEALFEQALLHADRAEPIPLPRTLPIPTPRPGGTLRKVKQRMLRETALPALAAALRRRRAPDSRKVFPCPPAPKSARHEPIPLHPARIRSGDGCQARPILR